MSALGQKQTSAHVRIMSALPPKADIQDVQMLLHRTCEDCSAEWASLSLGDLESGVSQPSFWLLSNISTARLTKSCMLRFAFAGYSNAM
jgi:hypothetical protein